ICTLNLVATYFNAAQYDRARDALEAAGGVHPCRLVVLIAEETAKEESLTARVSVVRSAGTISMERVVLIATGRSVRHLESARLLARGAPIGDLAWARIFPWQGLAAEILDLPNLREHRGRIKKARVVCAGAVGAEGLLLLGWLQSRIPRLKVEAHAEGQPDAGDEPAQITAIPRAAPVALGHVSLLEFTAPPATFTL